MTDWREVLGLSLTAARQDGRGREIRLFDQGVDPNQQVPT
jgi:hypothetical protein